MAADASHTLPREPWGEWGALLYGSQVGGTLHSQLQYLLRCLPPAMSCMTTGSCMAEDDGDTASKGQGSHRG